MVSDSMATNTLNLSTGKSHVSMSVVKWMPFVLYDFSFLILFIFFLSLNLFFYFFLMQFNFSSVCPVVFIYMNQNVVDNNNKKTEKKIRLFQFSSYWFFFGVFKQMNCTYERRTQIDVVVKCVLFSCLFCLFHWFITDCLSLSHEQSVTDKSTTTQTQKRKN